ncbi:MAG: MFS transporter [Firmicutes bacterium]|nr:MFS transporter [Alicyclobacillaceae bacterium]MCL6496395.1 MFS transporter [Bacillota bacterium]
MSKHATAESQSHARKLWVLAAVPFIMVLGNSMLIPVLPKMMQVMRLSLFQVGLLITVFSIPAGVIIPIAGAVSDRIGRRRIMAPALVIYGVGGLGAGLSAWLLPRPYPWIMAFRLLQGIGAGGTYQLAMAVAGDMFQNRRRASALGFLEAANGLGKVVSPIAGSLLALMVWFVPFFVYGVLALPAAALVWWTLREPPTAPEHGGLGGYWQGLKATLKAKAASMAVTFFAGSVVLFILFGVLSDLSDILEKFFGYPELVRGLLIAIPVLASATTSYLSGTVLQARLAAWSRPIVALGLAVVALALAVAPAVLTVQPVWALAVLALQGIGTGAVLPAVNTLVTSATTTAERGVVTSLYGSVRFFGVALGPPLFSLAMDHRRPVFWAAAALSLTGAVLTWFFINERQMLPKRLRQGSEAPKPKPAPASTSRSLPRFRNRLR